MAKTMIDDAVDRFLCWNLPDDFGPDCGISFDPISNRGTPYEARREPVGTNLLTAEQAKVMFAHCLDLSAFRPAVKLWHTMTRQQLMKVGNELPEHYRPLIEAELAEADRLLTLIDGEQVAA